MLNNVLVIIIQALKQEALTRASGVRERPGHLVNMTIVVDSEVVVVTCCDRL